MSTNVTAAANSNTDPLKKVLKGAVNKHGEGNLEEHLQKLFNFLIQHYPGQAYEKFEEASYLLKHNIEVEQFMKVADDRDYHHLMNNLSAYTQNMQKLFQGPQPDEEGNEPEPAAAVGFVSDLLATSKVWQWAGVGFGEQETYRL